MHKHEQALIRVLADLDASVFGLESIDNRTRGENIALTQLETARFWLQNELIESDSA